MQDLESQLMQKDKEIQKLVAEKKVYEKISRTQEKKMNTHNYEAEASAQREEIRLLKQKVRELEDRDKQTEKADQKKHEHYLKIEEKYRELCQQYGIDPSGDTNKPASKLTKGTQQQSNKVLLNGKFDVTSKGKQGLTKSSEDSEKIEVFQQILF